MTVIYDTLLAHLPDRPPAPEVVVEVLRALLDADMLLLPAALLAGEASEHPLYLDWRAPEALDPVYRAALVGVYGAQERGELLDVLSATIASGRAACVWCAGLNAEHEHLASDLDLDGVEPMECVVGLVFTPTAGDPGISSPYYGTHYKTFFGEISQYLELCGPRAPIDDELATSCLARLLRPLWGELRAGTSMVSQD